MGTIPLGNNKKTINMKMIGIIILGFSFSFYINNSYSQLQIDNLATPEEMVQNICDESISYSNIVYIGNGIADGIFTTNNSIDLGMGEGVLLTTGDALIAIGPNDEPLAGHVDTLLGHPLLDQLYGVISWDACGFDFDFVPNNDLLLCKTIFGSEEYPEYCEYIYEGFGVFVSGSKPGSGIYADTNIANIPYTALPINVFNINGVTPSNPEYYIDNTNGQFIQYDGYTIVIELSCYLIQDSIYNVKILTADYGDHYFDSGIFIEKNSFKSVNSTDLLSFGFMSSNNPGLQEDYLGIIENDSVFISLPYNTDLSSLVSTFSIYPGTDAFVEEVFQINDTSINNFSDPVIYTLISGNGNTKDWTAVVDYLPNDQNDILSYSFLAENNQSLPEDYFGEIIGQDIFIGIPYGTEITDLIASFTLSSEANAYVDDVLQLSGINTNDFTDPVNYEIIAENGDINQYEVIVSFITKVNSIFLNDFQLFPNPVNTELFIKSKNGENINEITIFNQLGQKVFYEKRANSNIDVSILEQGIYVVEVVTRNYKTMGKMIIKK
jgi:hypothetical protein